MMMKICRNLNKTYSYAPIDENGFTEKFLIHDENFYIEKTIRFQSFGGLIFLDVSNMDTNVKTSYEFETKKLQEMLEIIVR